MADSWIDPKYAMLFFILLIFAFLGGYMVYANKKMIDSGLYHKLEKKAKKKKESWSMD
jgi:ABC-type transporter Mla maintaining outer membrane lipid asymmetry permease subunit MlaE